MKLKFWQQDETDESDAVGRATTETRELRNRARPIADDLREHANRNHFAERIGRALGGQ